MDLFGQNKGNYSKIERALFMVGLHLFVSLLKNAEEKFVLLTIFNSDTVTCQNGFPPKLKVWYRAIM